jgi:hypothetical protein
MAHPAHRRIVQDLIFLLANRNWRNGSGPSMIERDDRNRGHPGLGSDVLEQIDVEAVNINEQKISSAAWGGAKPSILSGASLSR